MRRRLPATVLTVIVAGLVAATAAPADARSPGGNGLAPPDAYAAMKGTAPAQADAAARSRAKKNYGPSAPVPVLRGLNNPRQLALTTAGSLLVAETGRGGDTCVGEGEEQFCFGTTGAVAWAPVPSVQRNARPIRLVTGLLSAAGPDGTFAGGASGVSARSLSTIYSIQTYAPPEAVPPQVVRDQLGRLLRSRPFGTARPVADVTGYEMAKDPDGQGFDSNPYAVLDLGNRVLVADAAGNDILQWKNGRLSTFAVLPQVKTGSCAGVPNDNGTTGCDPVPTGLAVGPDGAIYVSGLAAEALGEGRVWKLNPRTGAIMRTWRGLSNVVGVAVGRDGSVYASQLFTRIGDEGPDLFSGAVTRIAPNGRRTSVDVPTPAGVAVDARNNVYVSAWSIAPATGAFGIPDSDGQVWRLRF